MERPKVGAHSIFVARGQAQATKIEWGLHPHHQGGITGGLPATNAGESLEGSPMLWNDPGWGPQKVGQPGQAGSLIGSPGVHTG